MIALRASARLQLHAGFGLRDAAARVPYYAALGVSHVYLSPIGAAVPGSTHGYDAIDPGRVNPELGGEAALADLRDALRAHAMGLILDIVPNHVAAHPDNPWWWDVLRRGRRSRHARWFDIEWDAPGCEGKLWLPVLDRPCAQALAEGALVPEPGPDGEPLLRYGGQRFPLGAEGAGVPPDRGARAEWVRTLAEDARAGGDALRGLLDRQAYRLAWWRTGNDRVNYRRFFDITSLAALRIERPEVFDAVHALPLRLIREGAVDGLRIDHIDGLADPRGYLRRLRRAVDAAARERGDRPGRVAIFVEKILAPGEALPEDWPCDGSTGYDFMDQVGGLLHDPGGEADLRALWRRAAGRSGDFAGEERAARAQMLAGPLQAEFQRALRALEGAARFDPVARELGAPLLARGLAAVLAQFPVYRTYADRDGLHGADAARFAAAAARAAAGADPGVRAAIEALSRCMRDGEGIGGAARARRRILRRRFEQLSAPLNAKAVEDTAFYRHGVLLSRNEVGSHPARFALAPEAFHAACAERARRHPRALLITASHDHKRGEDVRARLAVLSERAGWWARQVQAFDARAGALRDSPQAPAPGDALLLWQTLVAAWPPELQPDDAGGLRAYAARVADWQRKALREAKLRSAWTDPDEAYEAAARALLERTLLAAEGAALRAALHAAATAIGPAGALNGLAQTVLRLTVPGTPDLYQGCEGWDLSLVDPDNRRAVDYARREAWLRDGEAWPRLLARWRDGAVKARTVAQVLQLRRQAPELFARGDYRPQACAGPFAAHAVAFLRRHRDAALFVAVPRCVAPWLEGAALPLPDAARWGEAAFTLPDGRWRHVLDGREFALAGAPLPLAELFRPTPVAVLIRTA
ncbi:malto-oligosyltrehalose synthase [Vulcaniibacterium tengchongense]|uniref:Maltooligosyl trehalose synthase n=1 Tax=Vulcaniibacterium tengchongense TaxID=1273429 RepID=A0A3N4UXF1_9GAMM|nr:malto-oligosyltrehalose synthase [Vulcaniibacterium tengchongense]RPE74798.1 maltooligosyl trehalose synthase [Vulcaniibacterium tengchongense]